MLKVLEVNGKELKLSKVSSVKSVGIKKVYDFEVAGVHNYYVGGINVHNCEYHSMLKYYSDKYGEKLLKFNDTYIAYPTRGIMAYPAGPDKRVLRGRTRYFACIKGDQYVMTDSGLIPMEDVQDGMVAPIGSKSGTIRNHTMTGVKDVLKLTLNAGQELVASPEHKVVVYRKGKFKKVQMQNLRMSDKVCVGLGGKYPDTLELPHLNIPVCLYDVVIGLFLNYRGEIDQTVIKNFVAASGVATRGVSAILSKMRKSGAINKHYRKGKMFKGMDRCTYTLNCEETLLTYQTYTYGLKIPTEVTPEFGEFVGMLLADGNLKDSHHKGIWFCSTSKARVRRFHHLTYKLFGHKNHTVAVDASERTGRAASWKSTLCNRHVIKFLRLVGLDDSYSADKVIPWSVLRAPRGAVLACLRAMYLCDGREHKRHIVYLTTSKKMASQVQQLVMREGIPLNMKVVRNYEACPIKYQEGRIIQVFQMEADTRYGKELADLLGYSIDRVGERRELFYEETKDKSIVTTTIYSITKERGKVKVYDMTVGHKRHAYQASGMLVANSVDEIGWFDSNKDSNKVKDNAHEVVGALDRSLLTVRGAAERLIRDGYDDVYPAYAMNVSSPSHRNDMICLLVRKSLNSKSAYGVTRPTWEVNPDLPRISAAIEDAYRDDPQTAERDYGAVPPLASSPLISSEKQIEAVLKGRPNLLNIKRTVRRKQKVGESFTLAKMVKSKGFRKPTIMAIDAGYTNNSFSGVIGNVVDHDTVVVRAMFEIIPARGAPLNHAEIFTDLLLPAMEKYNVKILLADRWNSIKLLQDAKLLHDLEVSAQHSLKYPQLFNVKTRVQQGSLILPEPERGSLTECLNFESADYPECFNMQPASHLAMQLATVKDTGRTVDKGDGYTDDLFRALALFTYACDIEDYRIILDEAPEEDDMGERPTAFGVSGHASGGGTSWGVGGGSSQASDGIGFIGGYLPNRR